jgi:hypothetical protein
MAADAAVRTTPHGAAEFVFSATVLAVTERSSADPDQFRSDTIS